MSQQSSEARRQLKEIRDPEQVRALSELTAKIDELVEAEMGRKLPFISLIVTPTGGLCFFTNRRNNNDVRAMLEAALETLTELPDRFISVDQEPKQ